MRGHRIAMVLAFFVVTGCKQVKPPEPVPASAYIQPDTPPTYTRRSEAARPELTFTDITKEAGVAFTHFTGAVGKKWMPETMGGGGAFLDYDGDQRPDILLVNGDHWPGEEAKATGTNAEPPVSRLFRNRGAGAFEDVTGRCGLDQVRCYGMGAAIADYDADGDADIFMTTVGKDRLLRNDNGQFVDVTDAAGVGFSTCNGEALPWEWSTGAAWLDHDRDGDLDLFVANYVQWTPETDIWSTLDGKSKAYSTPQPYQGATCVLFRNNGDGTFADATKQAGVFNPEGKSLGVIVDDFNDDAWPDIVVTNDTQPNFLYVNNQDGTFTDRALSLGVAYDESGLARAGMGVGVADIRNNGAKSIAIGNFSGEPVSLFTQVGLDAFIDQAGSARLAKPTTVSLTFGLVFADFNLDGYEDVLLANGHIEPEIEAVHEDWSFAQRPQLFMNNHAGQFVEMTDEAGEPFRRTIVGRTAVTADIDGDGDLDALLTANGGSPTLLRNDTRSAGSVLRVRLMANGKNPQAVGARVRVHAGGMVQTRFITTGGSYLGQSELVATFGLDEAKRVERLEVRWPDGQIETLDASPSNSSIVIQQGRGVVSSERIGDEQAATARVERPGT